MSLKFAKDWRVDGAIVTQKFCYRHETDILFVRKALEANDGPTCFNVTIAAVP